MTEDKQDEKEGVSVMSDDADDEGEELIRWLGHASPGLDGADAVDRASMESFLEHGGVMAIPIWSEGMKRAFASPPTREEWCIACPHLLPELLHLCEQYAGWFSGADDEVASSLYAHLTELIAQFRSQSLRLDPLTVAECIGDVISTVDERNGRYHYPRHWRFIQLMDEIERQLLRIGSIMHVSSRSSRSFRLQTRPRNCDWLQRSVGEHFIDMTRSIVKCRGVKMTELAVAMVLRFATSFNTADFVGNWGTHICAAWQYAQRRGEIHIRFDSESISSQ